MMDTFEGLRALEPEQIARLVQNIDDRTLGQALWPASEETWAAFRDHLPGPVRQFAEEKRQFQGDLADRYFPQHSAELPPLASFDDVLRLTAREIQTTLREVDQERLATALAGASDQVRSRVLTNLSQQVRQSVEAEVAAYGGDAAQVALAQQDFLQASERVCPAAVAEAREVVAEAVAAQEQVAVIWSQLSSTE